MKKVKWKIKLYVMINNNLTQYAVENRIAVKKDPVTTGNVS